MSFESLLYRGLWKGTWFWDEESNRLNFIPEIPDKVARKPKPRLVFPMSGLRYATIKVNIRFKTTVSEGEQMRLKRILRRQQASRGDSVVRIEDVKTVAVFLCVEALPNFFLRFIQNEHINQLLRACVVYIQFYLRTCENVLKTQHLLRAIPPSGKATTYQSMKHDLDDLRVLIGRFYAGIIFGELGYGSTSNISRTDEILLFEYFLKLSIYIVWIALGRRYFPTIKSEIGRIFRTGLFNCEKERNSSGHSPNMSAALYENLEKVKRDGKPPDRLKSISPIINNFMNMKEARLIIIGRPDFDILQDDRLRILTNYIFLPETHIAEAKITLGILGMHQRLFDCLLNPTQKRKLKLLVTGSPMDISPERTKLRQTALDIVNQTDDVKPPHLFDHIPQLPRPGEISVLNENQMEEIHEEREEEEEDWIENSDEVDVEVDEVEDI